MFQVDSCKGVVGSRIEVYTYLGGASCGESFDGQGWWVLRRIILLWMASLGRVVPPEGELKEVFGDGAPPDPLVDEVSDLKKEVTDLRKGLSNIERILQSAVTILILVGVAVSVVKLRRKPG